MVKAILNKKDYKTFKVETKREKKSFPMTSPEICTELGGDILDNFPELSVNVKKPDFILYVEIRESTYIYSEKIQAFGGMPQGTNGKAMLLLSGGIDSPVAGWMLANEDGDFGDSLLQLSITSERQKIKL